VWHDSWICVASQIHVCVMPHWCVCHDSFVRHKAIPWSYSGNVWHDSFICVTSKIQVCVLIHSHVWHDVFIWDMPYSYVTTQNLGVIPFIMWHDYFICVTHSCVCTDSFICVTGLMLMSQHTTLTLSHKICDMTHSHVRHDKFMCV